MDIKLKNKDKGMNKAVATLLIMVICAIAAVGMCSSYKAIKKTGVDPEYNYFETTEFQNKLISYSYVAANNITAETKGSPASQYLVYAPVQYDKEEEGEISKDDIEERMEDQKAEFNDTIYYWEAKLISNSRNLKYYAKTETRVDKNEDRLASLDENKDSYQFIVQLDFDENGLITVKNLKGASNIAFSHSSYLNWMERYTGYQFKPLTNMSIVFAVPNKLVGTDGITEGIYNTNTHQYTNYVAVVATIVLGLLILIAFLFPYRWVKRFEVLKIPFELWVVAAGITAFGMAFACDYVARNSIANTTITVGSLVLTYEWIMLCNFAVWFGIFFVTFLGVLAFKSIFKLGFKTYIRKRTIVGAVYAVLKKAVVGTVDIVSSIDLQDDNNKYILKLVGINAIILFIITCLWMAGIPVVIVYSIVLYFVIKKYVDVISSKYRILTEATNQIAEGNLDVTIEEDLGVFNPFKNNLEKIQGGFKKAVEEEVKSQKMKTDLISNVSHDLKTPLTAIISYADLLKDETLSTEKRVEYAEVLDRKAQRLQVLIEDLFEMSKASSGTMTLNMEQVDVISLLKQTLVEVEERFEEASLSVKTQYCAEKLMLNLDSERTYRVFENLLLNAEKYAMTNTRVFVEVTEEAGGVQIAIKNISAEEIDFAPNEIVERFVRGDKSRNTEGSGLGLAIAKSFTELQGGKFDIEVDGDLFKAMLWFKK